MFSLLEYLLGGNKPVYIFKHCTNSHGKCRTVIQYCYPVTTYLSRKDLESTEIPLWPNTTQTKNIAYTVYFILYKHVIFML